MTNRKLAYIVKDQNPLVLGLNETVQHACRLMWERRAGSVLIADTEERLRGIFTGRDAVRLLAKGNDAGTTRLAQAMTPNPVTVAPESRAIRSGLGNAIVGRQSRAGDEMWQIPDSEKLASTDFKLKHWQTWRRP